MRSVMGWLLVLLLVSSSRGEESGHPRLLVTADRLEEMKGKVSRKGWAKHAYNQLKKRIDKVAEEVEKDPEWLVSRLMMNWKTHYILPITKDSKWIGGEGRAPVPTPRFGGARDWKSVYGTPRELADWIPYNEWGDHVWMLDREKGESEWVHPSETGLAIESANRRLMKLAAEAAFLYWMTGEERYAKVAEPVLWAYMNGFFYVMPPRVVDPESGSPRIIGTTSFEVIHEDILILISQCYDFLYDYLVEIGRDPEVIQTGIKRMADRVIEGGLNEGNWNLFQAKIAAHGGLVLEENENYADGKGHEYYIDLVLDADLPSQLGLHQVINRGYDQETALWPEAPGYGFETTASILDVANLIAGDARGRELLETPVMERALLAQTELTHPNGLSIGIGDTTNVRVNAIALEMLIAAAREQGKEEQEKRLTALLVKEESEKRYSRKGQSNLYALTRFVDQLVDVSPADEKVGRTYFGGPLNVLMMRLPAEDVRDWLSLAMFGTAGGHAHSNGLAVEFFGAGLILAPDPGRGSSYWQRDQRHYYSRLPAHNTVIPNGKADYSPDPPKQLAMTLEAVEPDVGEEGVSPRIGFGQASFHYLKPSVSQRRTVMLVRDAEGSGFYFDVFRSKSSDPSLEGHHDYLYHGLAQDVVLSDSGGEELSLTECELLGELTGDMSGYDFFKDEKSLLSDVDFRARFELELPDGSVPTMDMWMVGGGERRLFSLEAPPNHAIRDKLPAGIGKMPMPTVLVRQEGEAWNHPFVAVYEPFIKEQGAGIRKVIPVNCRGERKGDVAVFVDGGRSMTLLLEAEDPRRGLAGESFELKGSVGAVIADENGIVEIYLGHGRSLTVGGLKIRALGDGPVSASLRRTTGGEWVCEGPAEFEVAGDEQEDVFDAIRRQSKGEK